MKSAKFGARSVWVWLAGVVAALTLGVAPAVAQAAPSYEEGEDSDLITGNSTANGLHPTKNRNFVRPQVDAITNYLDSRRPRGPVTDARESIVGRDATAGAQQLANAINGGLLDQPFAGPGMAAGYTPNETTGQWIDRHLQPLRDHNVNAWTNTTWSSPRDTHRPTRYDSDIWTVTIGADMPIVNEDLLFGVFGSYTHSDVDTTFNNGGVDSDIGTVGPYFMYTLNDFVSFDTTVAAVFGEHDNKVAGLGAAPGSSPKARGDQEMDGFFVSMNANANYWVGNWGVQGRLGFLHSDMETDSYNLSTGDPDFPTRISGNNNELTQISVATQFNYFYDKGLPYCEEVMAMPYLRLTWNYDLDHDNIQLPGGPGPPGGPRPSQVSQHPNDDDEVIIAWGVSLFGNGPLSGSFESGYTAGRSRFEAWTVSGTLNYAF